jgi:uncharacterized protein (DUF1684 family)
MLRSIPLLLLLPLIVRAQPADEALAHIELIRETRAFKDSLLRHGDDSPLLPDDRPGFAGLSYYPIDLQYRLVGQMHRYGRLRQIEVPDTGGTTLTMERFGRLYFSWREKEYWLEVYRSLENGQLEAFFRDESSGSTTYSGGRYVGIGPLQDGLYLIDFNMAYNPYCDYNPAYICPVPPPHNALPFSVEAGERTYGTDLAN